MFSKPEPVGVIEAGANARIDVTELHGNFEDRGLPLSELGMTIRKRKAATPNVVRARDIRKIGAAMVNLQVAIIQAAHVFFAENKGLAGAGAVENVTHLDVVVGRAVVGLRCSGAIQVSHLAVHGIGPNAIPVG